MCIGVLDPREMGIVTSTGDGNMSMYGDGRAVLNISTMSCAEDCSEDMNILLTVDTSPS